MAIRKRKIQANYLKVAGVFEKLALSFTEATESPSAQTSSKRYIDQASASQSVTGYEWSTSFNTDQIENSNVVAYIREIGEMLKLGADAESEYLIVDSDKPAMADGSYRARKFNVAIQVDSFDDNDGELAVTGTFLGIGDPIEGTFDTATKIFTPGFSPLTLGVLTVTSAIGTLSGDTKITVLPTLTVGNSYVYSTGATVTLPTVNAILTTGYTVWNGTADITVATGQQILIVEVDATNKAKKAGIQTVTAKA